MRTVAFAILAASLAFAALGDTITVKNCADKKCQSGCRSQTFAANTCLTEQGQPDTTLELSCYTLPSICANATIYSIGDTTCKDEAHAAYLSGVCSSCQNNFTFSCGALFGSIFWVVNCTDSECNNCGGAQIVQFNKCTKLYPYGNVIVHGLHPCPAVNVKQFQSKSCTGTPIEYQYPSGECIEGLVTTCNQNATLEEGEGNGAVDLTRHHN